MSAHGRQRYIRSPDNYDRNSPQHRADDPRGAVNRFLSVHVLNQSQRDKGIAERGPYMRKNSAEEQQLYQLSCYEARCSGGQYVV